MVGTSQKWPAKAGGRSPKGPAVAGTTVPLSGLLSRATPHLQLIALVIPHLRNPKSKIRYDIGFSLGALKKHTLTIACICYSVLGEHFSSVFARIERGQGADLGKGHFCARPIILRALLRGILHFEGTMGK